MIALDTNILIRYFAQDDEEQSPAAARLIEDELSAENPCFVSLVVICELVWVLGSRYAMKRTAIADVLSRLLEAPQILLEDDRAVVAAIARIDYDIADVIIDFIGRLHGCSKTVTFDRPFARLEGVELLKA